MKKSSFIILSGFILGIFYTNCTPNRFSLKEQSFPSEQQQEQVQTPPLTDTGGEQDDDMQVKDPLPSPRAFIGANGVDRQDCTGGTRLDPWKTWTGPRKFGCIKPGDAIYILPGTYDMDDGTFSDDGRNGTIRFSGKPEQSQYLIADPEAPKPWPVKFRGKYSVFGEWGIIHGIEFESTGGYPFVTFVSHFVLRNSFVHGRKQDIIDAANGLITPYDCIKFGNRISFPSGPRSEDLQILNNEIGECPEDCIDVTGARDLVYRGNNIYNCGMMQIKGGTENILIEQNRIHGFKEGLVGGSMACATGYCGSPDIPQMAVADRFVAKNVTIRNNLIYDIKYSAIAARGWQKVNIYHNTIYKSNTALSLGRTGFDFTDNYAKEYCADQACAPCTYMTSGCWQMKTFFAKEVLFKNNIIVETSSGVYADREATAGFVAADNIYFLKTSAQRFRVAGGGLAEQIFKLVDFPFESGSFEVDPVLSEPENGKFDIRNSSFACDRALPLEILYDFYDRKRDVKPDIGAIECSLQ